MIDWQGSGEQRLRTWRQFRLTLKDLPPEEALKSIAHEWSYCPWVSKHLPPHDHTIWPDPWSLLSEGTFCSLARGLGMLYTVALCEQFRDSELTISIHTDKAGERYELVTVDNSKVLNYIYDEVVDIGHVEPDLDLQFHYTKDDLHTNEFR